MADARGKAPKLKSHGGRRPGAGRKHAEVSRLRKEFDQVAHELIVDRLPELIGNLVRLANGGYERVERKLEPNDRGELVEVERKVEVADADREANKYLLDRVLGKPKQAVEMSGPDGQPIPLAVEQAIERIYGDDGIGDGAVRPGGA